MRIVVLTLLLVIGIGVWIVLFREPMQPTLPEIGPGVHKLDAGSRR